MNKYLVAVDNPKFHDEKLKELNRRFPYINPKPDENLNIEFHTKRIICDMWNNRAKYRTVAQISEITGISERQLYRRAELYKLPNRS